MTNTVTEALNIAGASGGGTGGGTTYGSVTNPLTLGSSTSGGNMGPIPGGGVVLLAVRDTLTVNGMILADGTTSSAGIGGGSGGSVNIVAGTLSGTGTVSAAGGSCTGGEDGGGGGRVAIVLTNAADTAFTSLAAIQTYGGTPSGAGEYGAAGTVYLKGTNQAYGRLIVNNNSHSSTRLTLLNSAVTDKTAGDVVLRNLGYMGLSAGETLTVYGSWSNAVATNAISGGTVVFAETNPNPVTVWGGNTWSNLTIATADKIVNFQAGATQFVYGVPAFSNVTLQSTTTGYWYLLKQGSGTPGRGQGHGAVQQCHQRLGIPLSKGLDRQRQQRELDLPAAAGQPVHAEVVGFEIRDSRFGKTDQCVYCAGRYAPRSHCSHDPIGDRQIVLLSGQSPIAVDPHL